MKTMRSPGRPGDETPAPAASQERRRPRRAGWPPGRPRNATCLPGRRRRPGWPRSEGPLCRPWPREPASSGESIVPPAATKNAWAPPTTIWPVAPGTWRSALTGRAAAAAGASGRTRTIAQVHVGGPRLGFPLPQASRATAVSLTVSLTEQPGNDQEACPGGRRNRGDRDPWVVGWSRKSNRTWATPLASAASAPRPKVPVAARDPGS